MEFKEYIDNSSNIVFFGGAGVSTESGIPDFRSTDGLYNQKYDSPPEVILSHSFFVNNTEKFYEFYRDKMIYENAKPNITHKILAQLELMGKLKGIVTQNIDGLHQKAGNKNIFELHGSIYRNYCTKCGKFYSVDFIKNSVGIPICECGGIIKPDVVLYEESLDQNTLNGAIRIIKNADVLIVGGTSLSVYPAAGLIKYYGGNKLILINKSTTPFDNAANLLICDSLGNVMIKIFNKK